MTPKRASSTVFWPGRCARRWDCRSTHGESVLLEKGLWPTTALYELCLRFARRAVKQPATHPCHRLMLGEMQPRASPATGLTSRLTGVRAVALLSRYGLHRARELAELTDADLPRIVRQRLVRAFLAAVPPLVQSLNSVRVQLGVACHLFLEPHTVACMRSRCRLNRVNSNRLALRRRKGRCRF